LIRNHLIFSLLNHAAVWSDYGTEMIPRAFFCNGMVQVDGKKMSKSEGNFFTLNEMASKYGADATRMACARAGDTLNDANFEMNSASNGILKLDHIHKVIEESIESLSKYRTEVSKDPRINFYDRLFESQMNECVYNTY